ncbi:MAG: hypothetical protein OXF97_03980 [Nitrospira sp.]|nr:hypothetical protein [Nitrospira sp.]MCY3956598.1 hypothetical protein [Nitrospira sp.]MCY4133287.1 hypothetical protein [Nitrospira sp.]
MTNRLRTTALLPLVAFSIVSLPAMTAPIQAAAIQGFGTLKFGMTPAEVEALEDCSSQNECLYDLLGKNRYFTLAYGPSAGAPSGDGGTPTTLSHIDIEMGTYTQEWFLEVFEVLASQYPINHQPTDQEQAVFRDGIAQELVFGFVDGFVLLKIVRRPFGNMIIHVVFQDAAHAQGQRDTWNAAVTP